MATATKAGACLFGTILLYLCTQVQRQNLTIQKNQVFLRHFGYRLSLLVNNTIRNPQNPLNKTTFQPFTSLTNAFHYLFHQLPVTNCAFVTFSSPKVFQCNPPRAEHAMAAVLIKSSHEMIKQASIQANPYSSVEKFPRTGHQKCYTKYPHGFKFSTCILYQLKIILSLQKYILLDSLAHGFCLRHTSTRMSSPFPRERLTLNIKSSTRRNFTT